MAGSSNDHTRIINMDPKATLAWLAKRLAAEAPKRSATNSKYGMESVNFQDVIAVLNCAIDLD